MYDGVDDYLAAVAGLVHRGLAAGDPVAVVVPEPQLGLLHAELAGEGDGVWWVNMADVGRNPGRILPEVLLAFADRYPDQQARIVGEPIWPGRHDEEYQAAVQHEALINLAFAGRAGTICCPYDAARLEPRAVADAARTHPLVTDRTGTRSSSDYTDPARLAAACYADVPAAPDWASRLAFGPAELPKVRAATKAAAAAAGLTEPRVADVQLAVHEVAANTVIHGGGLGELRWWLRDDTLVYEIRDSGHISDPLVGRRPAHPLAEGGRGLLLANRLSDLVQLHTSPTGTTTRLHIRTMRFN